MAKAKKDSLLDIETERAEPQAFDGLGDGQNGETAALLNTTGRQVVVDMLSEGVTDAAAMGSSCATTAPRLPGAGTRRSSSVSSLHGAMRPISRKNSRAI